MSNPLELQDGQISYADAAVIASMVALVSVMTGEYYDSGDAMDQHNALRDLGDLMDTKHYLPRFDVEDVGGGCKRLTCPVMGPDNPAGIVSVFDTSVDLWRSRAHLEDYDGSQPPLLHATLTQHEENDDE